MTTAAAPYAIPLFVSALALTGIMWLAWERRQMQGAPRLGLLMLTVATYQVGYALELSSTSETWASFWIRIEHLGVAFQPYFLLTLASVYTDNPWFQLPRVRAVLLAFPITTTVLASTNTLHELYWSDFHLVQYGDLYRAAFSRGLWYWLDTIYIWVLNLAALALLVRAYRHATGIYRGQAAILIVGTSFPLAAFALYLVGAVPEHIDPIPFALIPSALLLAWGVLYRKLLSIMPVARDTVFSSLRDPVIVLDPRGTVVDFNAAAVQLLGRPQASLLGLRGEALLTPWIDLATLKQAGEQGQEITVERNGETLICDARWIGLQKNRKRSIGSLVVLHDITARKRAELERERLIAELNAFTRTVAHDLKVPLAVLVPYSLTLRDEIAQLSHQEIVEYAALIAETGLKMNDIIDALLLLAQMEHRQDQTFSPVDLHSVVTQALKRLATQLEAAQAQVIVPERLPSVMGFIPWVEQILVNYVSNAIKYGGRPPVITLGAEEQPNGTVRCWVRDNGPGLSAEEQAQLFTDFTRLHETRASGHGLGLSIVRRIVERLGGQVGVTSIVGQGSEFYFILPGVPAEVTQENKP